jgi:hypothetical protein
MLGRAMVTTVTSRMSISWAIPRSPRILQRCGLGCNAGTVEVAAE